MDKYAVFGNPIVQSKSPLIHQQFASQTDQVMEYSAILPEVDGFKDAIKLFIQSGAKGCNVTAPFKHDAYEIADELSVYAKMAGAVNTLSFIDGQIVADNTDGRGLIADLKHHKVELNNKRVLLIGAGGAARGVLLPLMDEQPSHLTIVNRTVSKAQQLADMLNSEAKVNAVGFDELGTQSFDVVINASSSGLSKQLPPVTANIFHNTSICYDMVYGAGQTTFNQWAVDNGVKRVIDGLGMLIEQAALSFQIWRGVKPATEQIRTTLRQQLN
ncbi:shikimate dehydrogenase [Neptunicella marina]|uniref:Shikimate dehydrogenase (NADP(+)) n=1 Tax=Neptunicella marina TaxID=2125989 RepID=A0A8J6IUK9_9ALTE|nr:shikimate dehydrogenase [Neptunicella marina]MBC3766604.1 shikimate dehydrogenase [Neptunicella marina]